MVVVLALKRMLPHEPQAMFSRPWSCEAGSGESGNSVVEAAADNEVEVELVSRGILGKAVSLSDSRFERDDDGSRVVLVGMTRAGSISLSATTSEEEIASSKFRPGWMEGMRSTAWGPILQVTPVCGTWTERVMELIFEWYSAWYLALSDRIVCCCVGFQDGEYLPINKREKLSAA